MNIFCKETQAHLQMHPHLQEAAAKMSTSGSLITPDLWLRECKSSHSGSEHSHSPHEELSDSKDSGSEQNMPFLQHTPPPMPAPAPSKSVPPVLSSNSRSHEERQKETPLSLVRTNRVRDKESSRSKRSSRRNHHKRIPELHNDNAHLHAPSGNSTMPSIRLNTSPTVVNGPSPVSHHTPPTKNSPRPAHHPIPPPLALGPDQIRPPFSFPPGLYPPAVHLMAHQQMEALARMQHSLGIRPGGGGPPFPFPLGLVPPFPHGPPAPHNIPTLSMSHEPHLPHPPLPSHQRPLHQNVPTSTHTSSNSDRASMTNSSLLPPVTVMVPYPIPLPLPIPIPLFIPVPKEMLDRLLEENKQKSQKSLSPNGTRQDDNHRTSTSENMKPADLSITRVSSEGQQTSSDSINRVKKSCHVDINDSSSSSSIESLRQTSKPLEPTRKRVYSPWSCESDDPDGSVGDRDSDLDSDQISTEKKDQITLKLHKRFSNSVSSKHKRLPEDLSMPESKKKSLKSNSTHYKK